MHQKKAQASYLKIVLIAIAFLVIILPFVWRIGEQTAYASRITACKASVEANAQLHIGGLDFSKNIKCPTKELTIKTKDQDEIKRILADEMAECWGIFGQGKLHLFKEKGIYCAICSRIDFNTKESIGTFSEYLLKTKKPNSEVTYADYLVGYKTPNAETYAEDILAKSGTDITIDPSKTYSTLFIYAKGKDDIGNLKDAVGGTGKAVAIAGLAGGTVAGAGSVIALFLLGSNPVGWVTAGFIVVGAGGTALYTYYAGEPPVWMALTTLTEYSKEELDRYQCKYLPVEQS